MRDKIFYAIVSLCLIVAITITTVLYFRVVEANKIVTKAEIVIQDYAAHQKRFSELMFKYDVSYSDEGCEFGWQLTARPYTAKYELSYAFELVGKDSLFIKEYKHLFDE